MTVKARTIRESEVMLDDTIIAELRARLRGTLLHPGEPGYDDARTVARMDGQWNRPPHDGLGEAPPGGILDLSDIQARRLDVASDATKDLKIRDRGRKALNALESACLNRPMVRQNNWDLVFPGG